MTRDADLLTAELTEAARTADQGLCRYCEDWLDPQAHGERYTLGPVNTTVMAHEACLDEPW